MYTKTMMLIVLLPGLIGAFLFGMRFSTWRDRRRPRAPITESQAEARWMALRMRRGEGFAE